MTNIEIVENFDGIKQVVIDNGDATFTSMSKAEYDRLQVEHLTEISTPDEA